MGHDNLREIEASASIPYLNIVLEERGCIYITEAIGKDACSRIYGVLDIYWFITRVGSL